MKHYIYILIILFALSSCASDYYVLNKYRNVKLPALEGNRANNALKVSLIADDAVLIEENSNTSLRKVGVTQYEKKFILKRISGNSFSIIERSSPNINKPNDGLMMEFGDIGFSLYEKGKLIKRNSNFELKNNYDYLFNIRQDGDYTTLVVDCDTLMKYKSTLPSSEFTIFNTTETTALEIYSFDVQEMYEDYEF